MYRSVPLLLIVLYVDVSKTRPRDPSLQQPEADRRASKFLRTIPSSMAPQQYAYPAPRAYANHKEWSGREDSFETVTRTPAPREWYPRSSSDLERSDRVSESRPRPTATFRRPSFLTSFRAMFTGVSEARLATIPRRLSILSNRPRRSSVITRHVEGLFHL